MTSDAPGRRSRHRGGGRPCPTTPVAIRWLAALALLAPAPPATAWSIHCDKNLYEGPDFLTQLQQASDVFEATVRQEGGKGKDGSVQFVLDVAKAYKGGAAGRVTFKDPFNTEENSEISLPAGERILVVASREPTGVYAALDACAVTEALHLEFELRRHLAAHGSLVRADTRALRAAAAHPDPRLRQAVYLALARRGDDGIAALVDGLARDKDMPSRALAALALQQAAGKAGDLQWRALPIIHKSLAGARGNAVRTELLIAAARLAGADKTRRPVVAALLKAERDCEVTQAAVLAMEPAIREYLDKTLPADASGLKSWLRADAFVACR